MPLHIQQHWRRKIQLAERQARPVQSTIDHQQSPSLTPLCRRRGSKPRSSNAFLVSLVYLLAICWSGPRTASACLASQPQTGSPNSLILRVRMPDGVVKRVKTTVSETVDNIMAKLGMEKGEGGERLSTDAASGSDAAEGSASIAALGLKNGDFLYVKVKQPLLVQSVSLLFIIYLLELQYE